MLKNLKNRPIFKLNCLNKKGKSFVIQSNALRDAMKLKKRLIAETELEIEDLRKKIKKEY